MTLSLRALLSGIVDYAGLFPPANLDMKTAVANYAGYRGGERSWMLGWFVAPVSRLDEFLRCANEYIESADTPWRLSAIIGENVKDDFARVAAFNQVGHGASIEAVELSAGSAGDVAAIAEALPGGVRAFVEVPLTADPEPFVKAIRSARLRAKARTGGVTAGSIPSVEDVSRFIRCCYAVDVPFKATAGLHHPIRGMQALTYEDESPRSIMHGFLNVFLTAAFCFNGIGSADARLRRIPTAGSARFSRSGHSAHRRSRSVLG